MTPEYSEFLAHYGVKGQKWGTRQWQNEDGSYTEAGKHHYGWGYGRQSNGYAPAPSGTPRHAMGGPKPSGMPRGAVAARSGRTAQQPRQRQLTQAEIEARKARTKKILAIGAGVAVAAALSYGAYKGSTKLRDTMRADVYKNFDTDPTHVHTFGSKYWDSSDRRKYSELTAKRADFVSNNITRRDAVAAKFQEKTGIRVNMPQSRKRVLEERRSENEYSNFIRSARERGMMNKSIHDARQELREQQISLEKYRNTAKIGVSKQYEAQHIAKREEQIEEARKRLNNLLLQRRAS